MNDAKLVAGLFFNMHLPQDRQFLDKYFKSESQRVFVRYYYLFGDSDRFIDHTGYFVSKRWIRNLKKKYNSLVEAYDNAKKNMDFSTLAKINAGDFSGDFK